MEPSGTVLAVHIEPITYVSFVELPMVLGMPKTTVKCSYGSPDRIGLWPANIGLTALSITLLEELPVSGVLFAGWTCNVGIGRYTTILIKLQKTHSEIAPDFVQKEAT